MNEQTIKIAGFISDSITDGQGLRYVIFAQGCPHKCPGCHNPHTHSFDGGKDFTVEEIIRKISKEAGKITSGITFSGGEPFYQSKGFATLAKKIRIAFPYFNIWCYTGYTYEQLLCSVDYKNLINLLDVVVDGKFESDKTSYNLKFRGSSNQRIISVPKSESEGKIILCEEYM